MCITDAKFSKGVSEDRFIFMIFGQTHIVSCFAIKNKNYIEINMRFNSMHHKSVYFNQKQYKLCLNVALNDVEDVHNDHIWTRFWPCTEVLWMSTALFKNSTHYESNPHQHLPLLFYYYVCISCVFTKHNLFFYCVKLKHL